MEFPWKHQRRFNAYANYFKVLFGERVQKLSINTGFTCPNRDGKLGFGGCTYCNNDSFNPSYCQPVKSIMQQIKEGIEFHQNRYRKANNYLAYFQAYSNTYASLDVLKSLYEQALQFPGIKGLVIGTRPDCIDIEKLKYLEELSKKYYIMLEYGIESCYDKTLKRINRKHNYQQSVDAINQTAAFGIKIGAHIIFGLPGECKEEMLEEAKILSKLPLNTIKFHQLQIIKGTPIEKEYRESPEQFTFFKLNDYIDFIIEFLEKLNPGFVVERLAGEVPPRFLSQFSSNWSLLRNDQILNLIEKRMEEKDSWQGKYYLSANPPSVPPCILV